MKLLNWTAAVKSESLDLLITAGIRYRFLGSLLRFNKLREFFMAGSLPSVTNTRANTCPHGLPLGACPICNGMGGGGSTKRKDEPRREGEMTYQQCYAQWKQMQRADAQKQAMQDAALKNAELVSKFQQQLNTVINKLSDVLSVIQQSVPKPIAKALNTVINNIIRPLINLVKELPQIMQNIGKAIENIKNEIIRAAEKLSALLGEVYNFVEKKIYNTLKRIKKRLVGLLSIFGLSQEEQEEEEEIVAIADKFSTFNT